MPVLDARTTSGVHEAEVARLVQAYAALPPGAPVHRGACEDLAIPEPLGPQTAARTPSGSRTSVPARFWSSRAMCSAMWPAQVPSRSRVMKPPRRPRLQARRATRPGSGWAARDRPHRQALHRWQAGATGLRLQHGSTSRGRTAFGRGPAGQSQRYSQRGRSGAQSLRMGEDHSAQPGAGPLLHRRKSFAARRRNWPRPRPSHRAG